MIKKSVQLGSIKFWTTFLTTAGAISSHMGSFARPTHYFAAAGENDDFVIAAINFRLNQSL